jgi:hypothetical protein
MERVYSMQGSAYEIWSSTGREYLDEKKNEMNSRK